jgi:hypothetical protein
MLCVLLLIVAGASAQCIPLRDLAPVTFRPGYFTTTVPGVPQLTCTTATPQHRPEVVPRRITCENRGFNGTDIAWHCLWYGPELFAFHMSVGNLTCQPCDGGVINGSCSLKYALHHDSFNGFVIPAFLPGAVIFMLVVKWCISMSE